MHPQIEFFYQLVGILGSRCTQEVSSGGTDVLKQFYEAVVMGWPERPLPGAKHEQLLLFGYMLSLEMPPGEHIYECGGFREVLPQA